jgi:hypothetical protein
MEVRWVDSHGAAGGWNPYRHYLDKKTRRPIMRSVGFVLADDKLGVVLANSIDPMLGLASEVMKIPKGSIVKRRKL